MTYHTYGVRLMKTPCALYGTASPPVSGGIMSRKLTILLVSVGVIALLGMKATTAKTSNVSRLVITEPDQLDLYIERLVWVESNGRENVVIVDTNGLKSHGCLQWQKPSWDYFTKKYNLAGDIMDCQKQKELTKLVLTHERNGYRHWLTSSRKIGLPPLPRS